MASTSAGTAESKLQGAFEASRIPDSSVSAGDAIARAEQETKKAGVLGVSFDPGASPEQKAAQARSRAPEELRHKSKPKSAAVATDIDDGQPKDYDLPSSPKARPVAANGPGSTANGSISKGDDDWWVQRTGWAPRFGTGDLDEEGTLLDHSTWLEERLQDKFFGDWYYNAAVIIFACLSSWLVAVLGGGLAWVLMVMAVCGTYYRTSLRRVRRNFRDDIRRESAKAKLETDSESLEWMNSFLSKFWPIVAPVIADIVIASVDQVLSTSTPAFLDSMRMKFFTLGSKPPRLEHVKSYPSSDDDIFLMDWRFSFTPKDTADMTTRQIKNKINPKVVLEVRVGKAMISKGLDVIVEDFAFSGLMRVKMKLQIPFPHVEKVEICFLERPTIDYACKPIGGEMLGFDINFIPGLESFIMEQIHANIGPIMYAPNVFPIEVAKMLSGSPVDQAIGILAITIYSAQGLVNPDKFATIDPYVTVSLNSRVALAQTKTIKQNSNPRWNETKHIIVTSLSDVLTLQVYDYNEYRKDRELGTASFDLKHFEEQAEWVNERLEIMANGKAHGIVTTDIRFFPVLTGRKLEDGREEPPPESNTGVVRFTVEQAKDLDGTKGLIGHLNPYAVLLLNGREIHTSKKLKRTNNPVWSDAYKEILITDRKSAKLGLAIRDDNTLLGDPILGSSQIKLDDLITLSEKGQEWYNLDGVKTGRAKMMLKWRPVALTGAGAGSGGYVTPIGVMRFHFINARDLRNLETVGKSDPYVRILQSGIERGRTVTFQNNLNPDWDEVLYVPMHSARERIVLDVMDQENLQKDRTLGQVEVLCSDYINQAEDGEYLVHDAKTPISGGLCMHGKGSIRGTLNYTAAFYPCLNVADPEEKNEQADARKKSADAGRLASLEPSKSVEKDKDDLEKEDNIQKVDSDSGKALTDSQAENEKPSQVKTPVKIRLTPEELVKHESGLIIFRLLDVELSRSNVHIEVIVDDYAFPAYVSTAIRTRKMNLDEIGDCFVRELEFSRLTIRLRTLNNKDDDKDSTVAKLTGNTLDVLRQCFNNPTVLKLKDDQGQISTIKASLKYIPVKMVLDPSESINNMGSLRVDVLDASDLPSADRNGYSDPFCRFELNDQNVYKTQIQKKTLHPAWNECFDVNIASRTASRFVCKVYDWDFASEPDFLGAAEINLELLGPFVAKEYNLSLDGKSGSIRLRLLFKPAYVTRSRQGSTTFAGTFAAPGKIVTGVAGVPIKGVGIAAMGVGKGASFVRHGFKTKKKEEDEVKVIPTSLITPEDKLSTANDGFGSLLRPEPLASGESATLTTPPGTSGGLSHSKSSNDVNATPLHSVETGTAHFTIVSTSGYPPSSSIMVYVKQLSNKKTIYKTKHIKSSTGTVKFDESFKHSCAADCQFQIQVKAHATFGSDDDLGEALFFVDERGTREEKSIKAGSGTVVVKSSFVPSENGFTESPKNGLRRSLLSKSHNGRGSREVTPVL